MPPDFDLDLELPFDQWKNREAVRQATGKSKVRFVSELGPDIAQRAHPVAFIRREDGIRGTGFLIAPDLLLTNQHVLEDDYQAAHCEVFFNYVQPGQDVYGRPLHADRYTCTVTGPNGLFLSSLFSSSGVDANRLDFALVRINQPTPPGAKWGYTPLLEDPTVQDNMALSIVQHPFGQPMKVGQGEGQLKHVDDLVIQYVTDTEHGSSGSPVFNKWWQVVALHHAGVQLPPTTRADGTVEPSQKGNEGINIVAIWRYLKQHASQVQLPTP